MALSFDTKRIALGAADAPLNLAADSDVGVSRNGIRQGWVAIQNTSTRTARYTLALRPPGATATDVGHVLSPGVVSRFSGIEGRRFFSH